MGSKIGTWLKAAFSKKDPEEPIKSPLARVCNVCTENWRGIFGTLVLFVIPFFLTDVKNRPDVTVMVIWGAMSWFLLLQPVNVPVTGLVPVFAFPCLHVLSSDEVCSKFFNPTMLLFIVGGYVLMLLNNCGFDRRVILWLLCQKNLTIYRLMMRSSFAAFILSMCSNRLLTTSAIMEYINEPLTVLQNTAKEGPPDANYAPFRFILTNAITTSSAIGSTAILHTSYSVLAMRTIWESHGATPDLFNFFQYSVFAIPVALIMFLLNLAYHVVLLKIIVNNSVSSDSCKEIENELFKLRAEIPPKITLHEILSLIFFVLSFTLYFFRWSEILNKIGTSMGWAHFRNLDPWKNPQIADATVSSLLAILLHIIPKSYNFVKYFQRGLKKRDLPPAKADPGILLWRFVDNNTCYGYMLLIGGGVALNAAVASSGLGQELQARGSFITGQGWCVGIGLVCLLSVLFSNVMSSVAAVVMILPFILNMTLPNTIWQNRLHLCSLAVGIGCSFGFALPFKYTPAYFMKTSGRVPLLQQIKYGIGSAIICFIVLWVALCCYADVVFIGDTEIGVPPTTTTARPATPK